MSAANGGLMERLGKGPVICAEGYLFELERRGYLQAGAYVPEVVLEHPEVVAQLHREFVRAGSDIVEAFTYYAHREKLRIIGRETDLEPINRQALETAKQVADDSGTLLAGNICNTNVFEPGDAEAAKACRAMFDEQIAWAMDYDPDLIVGETYGFTAEALIALEAIKTTGKPAVVTLALHRDNVTRDGDSPVEACKKLEDAGAQVVGLNCARGPWTMLQAVKDIRAAVSCHVAALPVPFRTDDTHPTFQSLVDEDCPCEIPHERPFPVALDPFTCNRYELGAFAKECHQAGVNYLGVCCGAAPHHIRSVAEALGRQPEASRFSPDMSKHYALGSDPSLKQSNKDYTKNL